MGWLLPLYMYIQSFSLLCLVFNLAKKDFLPVVNVLFLLAKKDFINFNFPKSKKSDTMHEDRINIQLACYIPDLFFSEIRNNTSRRASDEAMVLCMVELHSLINLYRIKSLAGLPNIVFFVWYGLSRSPLNGTLSCMEWKREEATTRALYLF